MARTIHERVGKARVRRPAPQGDPKPQKSKAKKPETRNKSLQSRLLFWAGISLLCLFVAAVAFVMGGYLALARAVDSLEEPEAVTSHPTYIYSQPVGETEGSRRVIGTIFQGENKKTTPLEEIPPGLLDALVAKEDERFREHAGVDLLGIVRALWIGVRQGEATEGASTITQQYVRNAYLSQERSLERKLKEALISVEIERRYEKDEILGLYLNTVYFGNNAYGVEAASETYFNKSAEKLTVAESATLVGLIWSPSTLGTNAEEATAQRNIVLDSMRDAGYITRQEHMEALETALPDPWPKAPMVETGLTGPGLTRNFAEVVREELVREYGANTVLAGDLSVYTTLDPNAQVEARRLLYDSGGFLSGPDDPDAALVSVEPGTGRVTAMVGNKDEESQFNLVTQGKRQPGSSFKPFALIAALEQGIDPETEFVSERKRYLVEDKEGNQEEWNVENYEDEYRGSISLREALWFSDNAVFTDLVTDAEGRGLDDGPRAVVDVAKRLGVTADLDDAHPSVALGAQEVSPLDMATAYATIANGGKKVTPTTIERVVYHEGQEDEEELTAPPRGEGEQVIDPEVARRATEIMVGNVNQGIAWKASLGDRPVAGKTGTSENFFDSWFVGFTPQLVTGVWMGYEEGGRTLTGLLNVGGQQLGPLAPPTVVWQSYMQKVLQDEPVEEFDGFRAETSRSSPDAAGPSAAPDGGTPAPADAAPVFPAEDTAAVN